MSEGRIAIVGAGSWGTALAQVFAEAGHSVHLWARSPERAEAIASSRQNAPYFAGQLHPAVHATGNIADAVRDCRAVVFAVPSQAMRAIAEATGDHLPAGVAAISVAKGFELGTGKRMTEVLSECLGQGRPTAAVSGPNIAAEIARGLPAATVVACTDGKVAADLRDLCSGPQVRFYSSTDVIGVEYGGALKNVIAIAAGICDGIGGGDNGKAAIITRGLAEITRLGAAAGANPLTFSGLTGVGDCVVTCMSPHSRNRQLGDAIGRGANANRYAAQTSMVIEGINATRAALAIADHHDVDVPIAREVHAVLFEDKPVASALADLMRRGPGEEIRGLGLHGSDA